MKNKIFVGEFIGSALLVMAIVGSGIMAECYLKYLVKKLTNSFTT